MSPRAATRAMAPEQPTPAVHNASRGQGEVKARSFLAALSANTHRLFVLSVDLHGQEEEEEGVREGYAGERTGEGGRGGRELTMNNKLKREAAKTAQMSLMMHQTGFGVSLCLR